MSAIRLLVMTDVSNYYLHASLVDLY